MDEQTEVIAGLDLGHSKVAVVVGKIAADGVSIVGAGSYPSKGLRRGTIINMASVVESIQKAVQETQALYGIKLDSVYASVSGSDIAGIKSSGNSRVRGMEVSPIDVEKTIDAAMSVAIPLERMAIHVIPQEYRLDDQEEIENPVGMAGARLEVNTYTVTAPVSKSDLILKCCNQSGLVVRDIVLDQLASAEAVLTAEERRFGVVLIDLGSESTKLAIYTRGFPAHIGTLNLGIAHIGNDVAAGLRTSPQQVREILLWVREELVKSGIELQSISSVVLTGGGSLLKGLPELASGIFERAVRVGSPQGISGLTHLVQDPSYATAAGLVLRCFSDRRRRGSA